MVKTAQLLWTGGWDSTYRLLELLVIQKRKVQTYYLIHPERRILQIELQTQEKIRQLILKKYPEASKLFLPTIITNINEIAKNDLISNQYQRLLSIKKLGIQYDWLSRFAEENRLSDLELSVDTYIPDGFFTNNIKQWLVKFDEGEHCNFRLADNPSNPDLTLFKNFSFPIHKLRKVDAQTIAEKHDFLDILENTWFCHTPVNNKPCGVCSPCLQTIKHGLGRRIPVSGHLRKFVRYTVKPPIKKILSLNQGLMRRLGYA